MGSSENSGRPRGDCCTGGSQRPWQGDRVSRRAFMGGIGATAVGGWTVAGLNWPLQGGVRGEGEVSAPPRKPLIVKPILTYETPSPRPETSWRNWGEIHSHDAAREEVGRIGSELREIGSLADFPLEVLPVSALTDAEQVARVGDLESADVTLIYAAGGWTDLLDAVAGSGRNVLFFVRRASGPLYLWYEIIHPRFLRAHTDHLSREGMGYDDVVVDSKEEILWRLRALCGLKNTRGARIIAVGGPGGWSSGGAEAPRLAMERWGLSVETVAYDELGRLIELAGRDESALSLARRRAAEYLADGGVTLETRREFVERCFLLDHVFRSLMKEYDCRALTINACMGTIMEVSKTAACLTLSTLNDDGYLAFCESDFVIIPAGILLAAISGRPPFLHNPTYPHEGRITLAHCTAPRRMDGGKLEPARIMTHFESDFGAAPKVEFTAGRELTIVDADFAAQRWLGFAAEVLEAPFLPICRSQLDVRLMCDDRELLAEMRGFHWMLVYGNYLKEVGYALKKTDIDWKCLT